ncbi:ceramide-1-phosphate transfer protein-like [Babylonia areolata]|uniref:ceramide-1-phosphate transfer protein-like n=1 Tax=Babylonia areolata TaxID=304850 RepID=UPI003FD1356D
MAAQVKDDHGKSDSDFNAEKVLKLFQGCKGENDEAVSIEYYCDAYEELCKLFKVFGTVFGFVTSDVVEKIGILRDYHRSEVGEHFATIQSMVRYEVDNNLTVQKKKASGCRTLLRLHRALEFIAELMTKIQSPDRSQKFSEEATKAYDDTLAKHHPWVIKKAVHVAMYMLPDRDSMLVKMKVENSPKGMDKIDQLIRQLRVIYDITQGLYSSHNLLDLP